MKTPTSTPVKQQNKTLFSGNHILQKLLPLRLWRKGLGAGLLLLLFFSLSLKAQIAIEWQKCYGGSLYEDATSMELTFDGGFVVAGFSGSNDGDVTGNHGNDDLWVIKLDSSGNLLWQKSFGGSYFERATSIKQTQDHGFIIGGYTSSIDGDITGNHGDTDFWLVELDYNGNIQWQKCFGGTSSDRMMSLQITSDYGYIMVGWTASNDGDVSGNHGSFDVWVVKVDSSANIQWQKCLGGTYSDEAYSIHETSDGGYFIAGYTISNDGDVSGLHGFRDVWILKLDGNGIILWQKCLGGSAHDIAYSSILSKEGGFIIAGRTDSNDGDVFGNHGNSDYWVVKLDENGGIQWQGCFGGADWDEARSIQQTLDGGYIVCGLASSVDGNLSVNFGSSDYWILKLDRDGILQWEKSFGGSLIDDGIIINQFSDGNYVIAGYTSSIDGNITGNHGLHDFWVVKLTEHYNLITGNIFYDANSNNIQDGGEPSLPNRKVNELNTGSFGFSGANGMYYVAVIDSGNYTVSPAPINNFSASPLTYSAYFSGIQQTDSLNDFALQPAGVFNDLCVTITPSSNFRAGMNATYVINYSNVGTTIINNCSIIFLPDNNLTYVSSNTVPASVFPDSVIWNIGTLTPFQTGSITVTVNVNAGTPIGTQIVSGVRIDPVAGDANPICNYNYWEVITTGPVDPNDILVSRATLLTTEFPNPPFLDYIIRFQNVGNDTAFTVRIYNPIDTNKLDINTLDFVASSHPVDMRYKFHERTMEFKFENILLPDSTTNEPMSHGFIRYKIKPRSTLVLYDTIPNFAVIHFDFEKPVMTNTAITAVVSPVGLTPGPSPKERGEVWMWPNPASDEITISFSNSKSSAPATIRLYDLTGRIVMEEKITSSEKKSTTLNIASLNKGMYMVEIEMNGEKQRGRFVKGR